MPSIAVVGAGIAGLTAGYRLARQGHDVTVFDGRDRVGGRMWSVRKGEFLMDVGAAFYLGTYREALALIEEVGLGPQLSTLPASGSIPRGGTLHHLDYTRPVRTALTTGVLSPWAKLRAIPLGVQTFRARKGLGYDAYDELAAFDDETVRGYARRTLGAEVHEFFARPLVSGAWVADDEETSLALCLWTARNLLVPDIYNLETGIQALPLRLAEHVQLRLGRAVGQVVDTGAAVEVDGERFDGCVIATQAQPALDLFGQMDANTRALYEPTRYRRLGCVCLGVARETPDASTYILPPPCDDPDTIAVIADHRKATHRAPAGKGLLSVLLSHEFLERTDDWSDERVLEHAVGVAERFHGPLDVEESMVMRWPESVPALYRGRFKLISAYNAGIDRTARVQFASDLDRIPGLNGALVSGGHAARRLTGALHAAAGDRIETPTSG